MHHGLLRGVGVSLVLGRQVGVRLGRRHGLINHGLGLGLNIDENNKKSLVVFLVWE